MTGYSHPSAVFTSPGGGVKIDPYDPAFNLEAADSGDPNLPVWDRVMGR